MKKTVLILLSLAISMTSFAKGDAKRVVIDDISKIDSLDEQYVPEPDKVIIYKQIPEFIMPALSDKQKESAKKKAKTRGKPVDSSKEGKAFNPTLKVYYPNSKKPKSPVPCAIFFGGGGWNNVHPTQFSLISRVLSDLGMVAINADYRSKKTMGKDDPTKSVEDAKSAVRYVREHAEELGINPNMIAVGGGSAGGHVAAATAFLDSYESPKDNLDISCVPNLLVLFNPVMDNSPEGYGNARVKDIFPAISPFHNIKDNIPASIVFVGTLDDFCKYTMCEKYKEILDSKGVDCELYVYEGQKHSFFNYFKGREMYMDTLKKLLNFMQKHKYILENNE